MRLITTGHVLAFSLGTLFVFGLEFTLDRFGRSIDFSSNFFATVLGAMIALLGTWIIIERDARVKRQTQEESNAVLVSEIYTKCNDTLNNLYNLRNHIRHCFQAVGQESPEHPSSFVLPLAALPDPVIFTSAEKAVFLRLRKTDLANDVAEWGTLHNTLIAAFAKYAELRSNLNLGVPLEIEGAAVRHDVTPEQRVQIIVLDSLVVQMRDRAEREVADFKAVFQRIKDETERQLSIKMDMILPD